MFTQFFSCHYVILSERCFTYQYILQTFDVATLYFTDHVRRKVMFSLVFFCSQGRGRFISHMNSPDRVTPSLPLPPPPKQVDPTPSPPPPTRRTRHEGPVEGPVRKDDPVPLDLEYSTCLTWGRGRAWSVLSCNFIGSLSSYVINCKNFMYVSVITFSWD